MPRTGWKLDEAFNLSDIKRMDNIPKMICPCRLLSMKHYDFDVSFKDEKYVNSLIRSNETLLMCGLSQTFRYTVGIEHILRYVLKFRPGTVEKANKCFNPDSRGTRIGQFYVGVHIRGGDFLHPSEKDHGLTVATESYYRNAIDHICRSHKNVKLFVTSDNIISAEKYISKVNTSVSSVYYSNNTQDVDLAMLSMSDAVIMSTGTFGWWAAWLANKTTIYYKNYPRIGSRFARSMNTTNYYCPSWLPME
jgi:galactoside 2-L-fucosyltransferase 1/2